MTWLHPMIVHFAIGLLLTAAVFDALGLARTSERLIFAGFWNVVVGAFAAVLTVATGLYAEATLGPHNAIANELLSVHKFLGIVVTGLDQRGITYDRFLPPSPAPRPAPRGPTPVEAGLDGAGR